MRKVIDAGDDTLPPCKSFSQSHSHPFVPLIVFFPPVIILSISAPVSLWCIIWPFLSSFFHPSRHCSLSFLYFSTAILVWSFSAVSSTGHFFGSVLLWQHHCTKDFLLLLFLNLRWKSCLIWCFTMRGRASLVTRWQINMGCFAAMFQIHSSSVN